MKTSKLLIATISVAAVSAATLIICCAILAENATARATGNYSTPVSESRWYVTGKNSSHEYIVRVMYASGKTFCGRDVRMEKIVSKIRKP